MNKWEKILPKVLNDEMELVNFKPEAIYNSIIKETALNEKIAHKITTDVIRMLIYICKSNVVKNEKNEIVEENKIKYLSGPLIREITCVILITHGFMAEKLMYSRVGIPRHDLKQMEIEKNKPIDKLNGDISNKVIKEYKNLDKLINNFNNGNIEKNL